MDDMQPFELYLILDNLNYSIKNDWEIGREIMWSNLQPWSKKKLKPEDVISLPWDDKQSKRKANVEVTHELVEKMQKKAEINKAALVAAGIL